MRATAFVIAILAAGIVSADTFGVAMAKERSAYDMKKAECKERAKAKHFGIHFVQRNRWINNCIAGAH